MRRGIIEATFVGGFTSQSIWKGWSPSKKTKAETEHSWWLLLLQLHYQPKWICSRNWLARGQNPILKTNLFIETDVPSRERGVQGTRVGQLGLNAKRGRMGAGGEATLGYLAQTGLLLFPFLKNQNHCFEYHPESTKWIENEILRAYKKSISIW